jgi:putative ABC transport system permease protein
LRENRHPEGGFRKEAAKMSWSYLETFWTDIRYGLRVVRRNPVFAFTIIGLLAVGIGANTTMFSVVNSVLIEPLPYKNPDRLLRLWESNPGKSLPEFAVSVPNFHDWQSQQSVFDEVAASEMSTFNLTSGSEPQRVAAASITVNLIPALGVAPILGRSFLPEEDSYGHNRVVLLSQGLWQSQFGGDRSILNKSIQLNGQSYTIIGVMPSGFQFPGLRDIWVPLVLDPAREPWRADRANRNLWVFGRLKRGITLEHATAEMNFLGRRLEKQYPQSNTGWGIRLRTFDDWLVPRNVRRSILTLSVAVGLVLLIVCANVASLLLARARMRLQETALRSALGASRKRVAQQLIVETLILANLGGILGLFLSFLGTRLIFSGNVQNLIRLNRPTLDSHVLVFTFGASLITGLVFGLAPAWWSTRFSLVERLNEGGRGSAGKITQRVASALVVVEVTLALVLLVSAGLMLRSFVRLQELALGFEPHRILASQISLPGSRYGEPEQRANFFAQALLRLQTTPGVADAAAASQLPLSENSWAMEIAFDSSDMAPGSIPLSADTAAITPHYFSTMGIPFLQGRDFTEEDGSDKEVLHLIISESFARIYWPNQNPLGKRFRPGKDNPFGTVVGVVGDVRSKMQEEIRPAFYFPYRAIGMPGLVLVVRTDVQPENFAHTLRSQIQSIDSQLPIYNTRTMEQVISNTNAQPRFQTALLLIFSIVALLLAVVGIYGLMAYLVSQRNREIGVRMALGAGASDIRNMVLRQGMKPVLLGILIGLVGCFVVTRWMKSLLFGVSETDPLTFLTVAPLLIAVAFVACYLPALRATKVDPSIILRNE